MRALLFISILFICSCSALWHSKQARKHVAKAKMKQPLIEIFKSDTVRIIETDTGFVNGLPFLKISEFIHYPCSEIDFSKIRTKTEIRQENKTERTRIRQGEKTNRTESKQGAKTNRTEIRQEEKTKRSKWWIWFLFGVLVGTTLTWLFLNFLREKLTFFKRKI